MNTEQKPEAPATECACRKALEDLEIRFKGVFDAYVRPTYHPSSSPEDDLDLSLVDARAALATPCPCAGLREDRRVASLLKHADDLRTQLAAANERAERESRSNALYRGLLDDQHAAYRAIERDLAAAQRDLREAVAVLRELRALNGHLAITARQSFLTTGHEKRLAAIVARFDVAHGDGTL